MEIYEADPSALNNISIGQTLEEARTQRPIATPKQYSCTYCTVGLCTVVVNIIQCYCGNVLCTPATTRPGSK